MAGRLVRLVRIVAVLWLAVAVSGVFEMIGDCGDEEHALQTTASVCLHGDGGYHEPESEPCSTTDHHAAPSCGCGCHHVSLLAQAHQPSAVARVTLHGVIFRLRILDRPDAPLIRPPIAG